MIKYLPLILSAILILVMGYMLVSCAINIPTYDDYDATIDFIRHYYFEPPFSLQKLKLLFSFHNEHCIAISRFSAAAYYYLFGEINFRHLILYQNLYFIGFYVVLLMILKRRKLLDSYTFFLVTVFLFSLSLWQVIFNYWGGIQTYTVFFFSYLSFYLLEKSEKAIQPSFMIAMLSAVLAVFSFGNGLLALFLGGFVLLAQKKYQQLIVWSVMSVVALGIVFSMKNLSSSGAYDGFRIDWMARLLFTFLGSAFFVNPSNQLLHGGNIIFCMIVGVGVLIFWIGLFFKGYAFKNPLLYSLLSFPILTGLLIAVSRFATKAAGGIAPRYMFISATIPVLIIVIALDSGLLKKEKLRYFVLPALLIWALSFYDNRKALLLYNDEQLRTIGQWQQDDHTPLIYYLPAEPYSTTMHWALDNHVVHLPSNQMAAEARKK